MTTRAYATPAAFKQALEQRLQATSTDGTDFARRRQLVVFDRFLARIARVFGDTATLKGGLVLELRVARARSTTDVDLSVVGSPRELIGRLQDAGRTKADALRATLHAALAKVDKRVDEVCADGTVTKDEGEAVHGLIKDLRHEMFGDDAR